MKYELSHLSDPDLIDNLRAVTTRERGATAEVLAHLAEVEARRLHLAAAYPSMHAYCVRELHYSEQAAYKRLRAARLARRLPVILDAVADGRINLAGVNLLAAYLSPGNVNEMLTAASHKSNFEIEVLIANRFPRLDVPETIAPARSVQSPDVFEARYVPCQLSARIVGTVDGESTTPSPATSLAAVATTLAVSAANSPTESFDSPAPAAPVPVSPPPPLTQPAAPAFIPRARIEPIAPERFALTLTMRREMNDKLRYARELLGHQVPSGDVAEVLERGLDALIAKLEKTRFGATDRPRSRTTVESAANGGLDDGSPSASDNASDAARDPRYIHAAVKRAVWARDGGRCTFVGEVGRRCESRTRLEFDHVLQVARGGKPTTGNLRLRCREHNQYGAEQSFGVAFMREKRQTA